MQTFRLKGGDLVLGSDGFEMVTGQEKLRQDLSTALREPIGVDRFHPRWGSMLDRYVGMSMQRDLSNVVKAEVVRILQNHVVVQNEAISDDVSAGRRSRFSTGEVIAAIESITVSEQFDRLGVQVTLRTMSGARLSLGSVNA